MFYYPSHQQTSLIFQLQTKKGSMQTENLELSNIALKEQHYLLEKKVLHFNFQLQPITHKIAQKNDPQPHPSQFKTKDMNDRRQSVQKAQQLRKQLLLEKIAAKNYKYEMRQKMQKQNKSIAQLNREQSLNKLNSTSFKGSNNQRLPIEKVRRIYSKSNQIQYSSTKGFHKNQDEKIFKLSGNQKVMLNKTMQSQEFKMSKLHKVKLPELNSWQKKLANINVHRNQQMRTTVNASDEINHQQFLNNQQPINPILKTTDVRYFGIQERKQDFQKQGKNLLKLIKKKYWFCDTLESEEIYENFENVLLSEEFI